MTDTAQTIINDALKTLGVIGAGETPDADSSTDALKYLNGMLESWSIEGRLIYAARTITKTLTANDGQYSIGSGADINVARPDTIESAWIADSDSVDHPLEIVDRARYDRIPDKTLTAAIPRKLFYDPTYANGTVYLYPVPTVANTLKMRANTLIGPYAELTDSFALPNGYRRAIVYNLALELAAPFQVNPSQYVVGIAEDAKDKLAAINFQIPRLQNDTARLGRNGTNYSISTDE
jgi:hypothetical protein